MSVRKRGSSWQVDLMLGGKRVRGTFEQAFDAETFEAQCRLAHRLGKPLPDPTPAKGQPTTMGKLLDLTTETVWKGQKAEGTSRAQARLYVDHCGPLVPPATALTTEAIAAFKTSLVGKRSGSTINRRLAGISMMCNVAFEQGIITKKPVIKWEKEAGGRLRYYTQDELDQIFASCERSYDAYAQLYKFLVDTGGRLGEVIGLKWDDLRDGMVTFRDTKNGDTRVVPLTPRCISLLRTASKTQRDQPGPFGWCTRHGIRSSWAKLRGYLSWLDDDCVVHTFRHTTASRLVQAGHDLYHVQRWMGHRSIAVTQRYAHLSPKTFGAMMTSLSDVTNDVTKGPNDDPSVTA